MATRHIVVLTLVIRLTIPDLVGPVGATTTEKLTDSAVKNDYQTVSDTPTTVVRKNETNTGNFHYF